MLGQKMKAVYITVYSKHRLTMEDVAYSVSNPILLDLLGAVRHNEVCAFLESIPVVRCPRNFGAKFKIGC